MKKGIITILTLLASIVSASANNVTVTSSVPLGLEGTIAIGLDNTDGFTACQMTLTLPDGISFVSIDNGSRLDETHTISKSVNGQTVTIAVMSGENVLFSGNSGALFYVNVTTDESVSEGDVLEATLSDMEFTSPDESKINPADITFNITIEEPVYKFDENASALPKFTAGDKGKVKMIRTIKANEWSTIVLPFTLTQAKAKAAFGDDVQLYEFAGFSTEYSDDDDVTPDAITINLTPYTMSTRKSMNGGKLFIIKTSKDIETIEAEDVTLANTISEVTKEDDFATTGKITGSLVSTTIPADGLFLSGGKFWYSTGKTKAKAFRCWFELGAVLNKETAFDARVNFNILEQGTTGIENHRVANDNDRYYNVNGQRIQNPKKGLYIKGNKKVVIK